jgi:predicted ribosomally synthesized peptide with SipW-like signal peptide
MKKILMSLAMIGILSSFVVGATRAYLSDTETSSDNLVTGGTLNLTVDNQEGAAVAHVTFANVVPAVQWLGAEYNHQWVLKNVGTVAGNVTYSIKNIRNLENTCNTPEIVALDATCGAGTDQGELGSQFKLLFQLNQAPYGYNQEIYPVSTASFTPAAYHLNPGETKAIYLRSWWINAANNNLAQSDSLEFDIEFKLDQE